MAKITNSSGYRLQFITHCNGRYSYLDSVRMALEGGCRWIQLRMKDADESLMEETALAAQKMCREHGATFIINDNVLLAKRIGADGVHLGKNDMSIADARNILGSKSIIGATVNSFEDIRGIISNSVPDYFGCGPFRFTSTKRNLAPTIGLEGYREILSRMVSAGTDIPIVAIGGIRMEDIAALLECGISGIALSGSVLISKAGYKSGFTAEQLMRASEEGIIDNKTIALGGVTLEHIPYLRQLNFGGVAMIGGIYNQEGVEKLKNWNRNK